MMRLGQSRVVHGLGWVRSGWVEIFQFFVGWIGLGWVHYNKSSKIFERIVLIHLKRG